MSKLAHLAHAVYRATIMKWRCKRRHIVFGSGSVVAKSVKASGAANVRIGKGCTIASNVMFWGNGDIVIEDGVTIRDYTWIHSSKNGGGVRIGKNTMIAPFCFIIDSDHGFDGASPVGSLPHSTGPITIEANVWIGTHCVILRGSHIGTGSVIGALSLVKGIVPNGSVFACEKAKMLRKL